MASDMFDWIVTRNEVIRRIYKNVFEHAQLEENHPRTIDFARNHFLEFCLLTLTGTINADHAIVIKRMRDRFEKDYGPKMFEYTVHATYWISKSLREEQIKVEIEHEIESREFLRSLPMDFKTSWLLTCESSNLPLKIKRRISPVLTTYAKHREWIEDRVNPPIFEV